MARRYLMLGALAAVGILGCMLIPKTPPPQTSPEAIANVILPDLDTDGRPEQLQVLPTKEAGHVLIQLNATNGPHDHDMMTIPAAPPLRFEKQGDHWLLVGDGAGEVAYVQLYKNPKVATPDLVVRAGDQAKRYLFVDRGFLKLDAHELIPGFSAGLVMMGDPDALLTSIGGPIGDDGSWRLPTSPPMSFKVQFNQDKRVTRVTFDSEALKSRQGLQVGVDATKLTTLLPGKREAENWVSPRYGIIGHIGEDQKVESITVSTPWREPEPKGK